MNDRKIIIAIDGYSSTGKSSFAKGLAAKLGYIYVDTGAMYRAITYFAYTNGFIDDSNKIRMNWLATILPQIDISFRMNSSGKSETYLNGANIESKIRTMQVSDKVSYISALAFVRVYVDRILRGMAADKGIIMDGRDIGTAVFPDAEFKIFMTASEEVRAHRRLAEIKAKGGSETFDEVLDNLRKRDRIDSTRKVNPLSKAHDAFLLDNSNMTMDQEYDWAREILRSKFNIEFIV